MLWLAICVLKQPRPQSTKLLDFLSFDSDSEYGTSVGRFDRQSSMPYFLYENYGSFPVGYSQLPDFGPAVADRRGNPPTKGQRVS